MAPDAGQSSRKSPAAAGAPHLTNLSRSREVASNRQLHRERELCDCRRGPVAHIRHRNACESGRHACRLRYSVADFELHFRRLAITNVVRRAQHDHPPVHESLYKMELGSPQWCGGPGGNALLTPGSAVPVQ